MLPLQNAFHFGMPPTDQLMLIGIKVTVAIPWLAMSASMKLSEDPQEGRKSFLMDSVTNETYKILMHVNRSYVLNARYVVAVLAQ